MDYDGLTYESVLKAFYVDDLLKSVQTVEMATKLALELISMLSRGGFRLTKFMSNRREVLDALPATEVSPSATVEISAEKMERALGYAWDTIKDGSPSRISRSSQHSPKEAC